MRYLVTGYLTPLDDASSRAGANILCISYRLGDAEVVCFAMSIKCLEVAVLDRIDNLDFEAFS